jgi:hypothetical protein
MRTFNAKLFYDHEALLLQEGLEDEVSAGQLFGDVGLSILRPYLFL